MATEPKAATEDVKIDLFEDDDEFEEFEINDVLLASLFYYCGASSTLCNMKLLFFSLYFGFVAIMKWYDKEEGKEVTQQWEDDWDDDDVSDDFSLQLRRELESNTEKN
ncbi:hypothetical protein VIGAN_03221600 [Vigna angularis var. angularis]|uniref:26S proteasome complex subunit SEM1 n=1 Tax=Vigna angularis var. angularis TaxID=157739 RepID=A0A0S3RNR7_PHAAN|nr:hypothetical protein VIGAN_03221600 [Vigna angularis var. angularis]